MNIFLCMKKVIRHIDDKILDMSIKEFDQKMIHYDFSSEELVIILGVVLNRQIIDQTKLQLNLKSDLNYRNKIITDFAIFSYIFVGDEYNDAIALKTLKIDLEQETDKELFSSTLNTLISDSSRIFKLSDALGNDNDRANMFAVNALLNIKRGIGIDNFHITLFTVYQSLELKLKHCLKKYIECEPSVQKKQINFHNLVRLIKLFSFNRISDEQMIQILKPLREYLRYFEKINPGGQAARYEATPDNNYFSGNNYVIIDEKQLLENFVQALSLLQRLYLKLIEIYDAPKAQESLPPFEFNNLDSNIAELIGANLGDYDLQINNKLKNLFDYQFLSDYQELINLSYQELLLLRFLIRIGFMQQVNHAVSQFLKN